MITGEHPFLNERYDWHSHERRKCVLKNRGFVELPPWFPTGGWPGYEYEFIGGIDVLMRPAPKFIDRVRWQFPSAARRFFLARMRKNALHR